MTKENKIKLWLVIVIISLILLIAATADGSTRIDKKYQVTIILPHCQYQLPKLYSTLQDAERVGSFEIKQISKAMNVDRYQPLLFSVQTIITKCECKK